MHRPPHNRDRHVVNQWILRREILNRAQHVVMHHLGPFLIALAWPGETLMRGMPGPARAFIRSRPARTRQAVARAHGYAGAMAELPRDEAAAIYRRLYWLRPRFDQVAPVAR